MTEQSPTDGWPGATPVSRARRAAIALATVVTVVLMIGLGFVRGAPTAMAADKSFSLSSLDVDATIAADGSMTVVEHITYVFSGGPFTVGIRSFHPDDRRRITEFTASDAGLPLTTVAPEQSPSGEWEWNFAEPISDDQRTFELRYTVPRAVTIGSDVGELYWQVLGKDHTGVGPTSIVVNLPGSFVAAQPGTAADNVDVVRAWGHGPRAGRIDVGSDQVSLHFDQVNAGRFVEVRVAIPAAAFTGDRASGARLAGIVAEEGKNVDGTLAEDAGRSFKPPKPTRGLGRILTLLSAAGGAIGTFVVGRRYGREPKPDSLVGEYWREPLADPPAVALANMSRGSVDLGNTIGSTVIDLAQRGYVRIEEHHEERFGPDKHEFILHRTDAPLNREKDPLRPFERLVIDKLFAGRATTTSEDISAWATADPTAAKAFADDLKAAVTDEFASRNYNSGRNSAGTRAVVMVAGAVAMVGVLAMILGTKLGWLAVGAAVAMLVGGLAVVQNRTQAGADEAAKAAGLKKFLEDFSQLSDAPAGHLILWERFLVFAVAFGVAGKLLAGLETRLPALLADPNFGVWYVGQGGPGRFRPIDQFPSSFGHSTATVLVPSKSGSSGGISSVGGGGGFGGGGFGAR